MIRMMNEVDSVLVDIDMFVYEQEGVDAGALRFYNDQGCGAVPGFNRGQFPNNIHPISLGGAGCLIVSCTG